MRATSLSAVFASLINNNILPAVRLVLELLVSGVKGLWTGVSPLPLSEMSRSDVDQSLCPEQLEFRKPLYHSYMQTVLQSLSPRRLPQERSHRGTPSAPCSNDAERGPALLVQLAQLQLLPPQGAPGWSTAKKWAELEAASSSTRGSGWVPSGPAGGPVRRRRSRSGALPREDLDNTGAPQPDAWMVRRSEIGGIGGGLLEQTRRWLGAQWAGLFLGVPSCPEPPGAA